jgi:hypothetical protein
MFFASDLRYHRQRSNLSRTHCQTALAAHNPKPGKECAYVRENRVIFGGILLMDWCLLPGLFCGASQTCN